MDTTLKTKKFVVSKCFADTVRSLKIYVHNVDKETQMQTAVRSPQNIFAVED